MIADRCGACEERRELYVVWARTFVAGLCEDCLMMPLTQESTGRELRVRTIDPAAFLSAPRVASFEDRARARQNH